MKKIKIIFFAGVCISWGSCVYGQWEADTRITDYPDYCDYGSFNNARTIAVRDTMVHIVWEHRDTVSSIGELYYIRSVNSGTTFEPDTQLSPQNVHTPSIAVRDSIVHIVWYDYRAGNQEIYYKRSVDNGASWGLDTRLTNNTAASYCPSVAVWDSVVHLVWYDERDGNYEIYYKRSVDNGASWELDTQLTNNTAYSGFPSVAVCGSAVHIVWWDGRDGNYEIYYKRSIDNGVNWGPDTRLTNTASLSWYPSIAVRNSIVQVVWHDSRNAGNYEIYYKRSVDDGVNWGPDTRLTNASADSYYPSIAVWDSVVHLVWNDARDGNDEIYYLWSVDNGLLWYPDRRLTNATGISQYNSVACWDCSYGYDVHVVWTDLRDGNQEIYYKRHHCEETAVEEARVKKSESVIVKESIVGGVRFGIYLAQAEVVTVNVYNVCGQLIDTRVLSLCAGENEFSWYHNKSGIYFFKFNNSIKIKAIVF
ncbi:MAG: hypothetical protein HY769_09640 [Candidatus Stahlbacteria bacterium]|nr:hypothetical protein [Candidatus Stahlbacteria bacterium]